LNLSINIKTGYVTYIAGKRLGGVVYINDLFSNRGEIATLNKTAGSDSERKVLEFAHRGLQLLTEYKPKLMGKVQAFMGETMQPGILDKKEKERIALGTEITQQCHYYIALHIRACKLAGVMVEEIMEFCGIAIMIGVVDRYLLIWLKWNAPSTSTILTSMAIRFKTTLIIH
jgi:AhpD family alkylhydroperoxidase